MSDFNGKIYPITDNSLLSMNYSAPVLSVIVPVDGTEVYIHKCLDSIIHQTFTNLEIIVVNDCSPGNIDEIILQYSRLPNLKYLKPESKLYIGGARNLGMTKATGKYITFCDSDDWLDLSTYEEMIKEMEDTSADIATCSLFREYPDHQSGIFKCFYDRRFSLDGILAFKIFTFQYQCEVVIVGQVTNKIYRNDFIKANNLYFLDELYFEDLDYNFRAILHAKKVVCVPHVRYHHLKRENSFVQSISQKHIRDFFSIFKNIKAHLEEQNKYEEYKFNFYAFAERFYNLVIRQIFEFELNDTKRKEMLRYSFSFLPSVFKLEEFIEYSAAEKIRKHLQPYISDTAIK
jgi:glycosyltransferase involved in cell wall biosynthesis